MAESTSSHVIDVSDETFERDVIQRSQEVPVVVDFWAPWCGPCQALGPLLEEKAASGEGSFLLAKVNVDESQQAAAALGVQSIPAVFAVRDGQVVNQFVGLLPDAQLDQWLGSLQPSPAEVALSEARRLKPTDPETALAKYREVLELDAESAPAKIELAELLLKQGDTDAAKTLIQELQDRGYMEPEAEAVASAVSLKAAGGQEGDLSQLQAQVQANPDDKTLQLKLAAAQVGAEKYEEALATCLALVQNDRQNTGEQAREMMVNIFRVLGGDHPLAGEYRRKLSAALY